MNKKHQPKSNPIAAVLSPSRDRRSGETLRGQRLKWKQIVHSHSKQIELSSASPSLHRKNKCDSERTRVPKPAVPGPTVQTPATRYQIGNFAPNQKPLYWDLSQLEQNPLVEHIRLLILTVENKPNFSKLLLSYERTRDHFIYSVGYIQIHGSDPRLHLNILYNETISKLCAILELSEKLNSEMSSSVEERTKCVQTRVRFAKEAFNDYMTSWLVDNWTNPYPDATMVEDLARNCGTKPSAVTNWLINARTSKWRPAIAQAYELKRPASLLREDSIKIFNREAFRKQKENGNVQPSPRKRARNE